MGMTPKTFIDLTGKRFGKRIVVRRVADAIKWHPTWLCRCDCGSEDLVLGQCLLKGASSCCFKCRKAKIKHGCGRRKAKTVEYNTWTGMKSRCTDKSSTSYANYGGRGIVVCERWENSFENFLADMGPRPSASHSIERIDNDGNYEPSNCRWATILEQNANTRHCKNVTFIGETHNLAEWARRFGFNQQTLQQRFSKGWTPLLALGTPLCSGGIIRR